MINIHIRRCPYDSCSRRPIFNGITSKMAAYCEWYAQDGMVNFCSRRCSDDSCTKRPTFNGKGTWMAV